MSLRLRDRTGRRFPALCAVALCAALLAVAPTSPAHAQRAPAASAGRTPTPAETFAWLKQLDAEKFTRPRYQELRSMEDLKRVTGLGLGGHVKPDNAHARYTADEMRHLKNLPALRLLDLMEAQVDDDALEVLAELDQLTHLMFGDAAATDAGIAHLTKLQGLTHLALAYPNNWRQPPPKITDKALEHVAQMQGLVFLNLSGTSVTGAGLGQLQKLPKLETLELMNTPLREDAVASLSTLKQLKILRIAPSMQTTISAAGINRIVQSLPGATVVDKGEPYPGMMPQGTYFRLETARR